jgi:hypothetical protein
MELNSIQAGSRVAEVALELEGHRPHNVREIEGEAQSAQLVQRSSDVTPKRDAIDAQRADIDIRAPRVTELQAQRRGFTAHFGQFVERPDNGDPMANSRSNAFGVVRSFELTLGRHVMHARGTAVSPEGLVSLPKQKSPADVVQIVGLGEALRLLCRSRLIRRLRAPYAPTKRSAAHERNLRLQPGVGVIKQAQRALRHPFAYLSIERWTGS